jgi:hypothetical protein
MMNLISKHILTIFSYHARHLSKKTCLNSCSRFGRLFLLAAFSRFFYYVVIEAQQTAGPGDGRQGEAVIVAASQ